MSEPGKREVSGASFEAESDFVRISKALWKRNIEILKEFIRIPNKSPAFDADWKKNGHMDRALALLVGYIKEQKPHIKGLTYEVVEHEGRTPLILITAEGTAPGNVLMYGHMDKQPEGGEWREGLDAWTPVQEGDKLYGRGGADDGYALFAALTSLRMLDEKGIPRPTTQIIIEAAEESGSTDLPHYLNFLGDRITEPDLIVCLDSEAGDYGRLWETNSLRGLVNGTLEVAILEEGVHSGKGSGIPPDTDLIHRQLLTRIQNTNTGEITLEALKVPIPDDVVLQAKAVADLLGDEVYKEFPFVQGGKPLTLDLVELILASTWKPALTVTGADGLPAPKDAGNVLLPKTTKKLSMRIPPGVDAKVAAAELKRVLEENPPYGARVTFTLTDEPADGWKAPISSTAFKKSVAEASRVHMGGEAMAKGTGGTIPFMSMLGEKYPNAEFLITGVLGPGSNAHGPNEFLDTEYAARLTAAIAHILAEYKHSTKER